MVENTPIFRKKEGKREERNSRLQRSNCLPRDVLPQAESLDSSFLNLFQSAHRSDMWIRSISGPELASADDRPAALGVVAGAGISTRSSGEDCLFALLES